MRVALGQRKFGFGCITKFDNGIVDLALAVRSRAFLEVGHD